MKQKNPALLFLVIGLVICILGSGLASLIQSSFGYSDVSNYRNQSLAEITDVINSNNAKTGRNIEASFTASKTALMTYKVLIPDNATAATPAPAIVLMHGGQSNKDTTAPLYIELARRGFVVIAFDAMGHGRTDKAVDSLTHNTMGMEAMVELAMSMDCVDQNAVAVTGHSWGDNGSAAVVNAINLGTSNPKISAFLCAQGSLAVFDLHEGAMDGVTFGFSAGKYDEMDTTYFGSYQLASTPFAIGWIQAVYPAFNESEVPLGVWFDANGPHEIQEGTKFTGTDGRVMYNPHNTHPAALFSNTAIGTNVNFFYGALGTPAGAKYIPSSSMIWGWYIAAIVVALFGWFCTILAVFNLLLKTKSFKALYKPVEAGERLPAFRNPKESVPAVVMFVVLVIVAYLTMTPCTTAGPKLIPTSTFFPNTSANSGAFGFWSLTMALVAIIAAYVVARIKEYMNRNDDTYSFANPLACAKTSFATVVHSFLLAFTVFIIAHLFLRLIDRVFNVTYVIATVDFTTFRYFKIFIMLRYLIIFAPFYIVNAALTANNRFSDLPDWASTGIVCLGNLGGVVIYLIREYSALFSTGLLATPDAAATNCLVWAMMVPMVLAPIISRYTYKKTGNIWTGAWLNAFLFIMMQVGTGQYMIEGIEITMFGF